jgi:hypothetical protein
MIKNSTKIFSFVRIKIRDLFHSFLPQLIFYNRIADLHGFLFSVMEIAQPHGNILLSLRDNNDAYIIEQEETCQ